MSRQTVAPPRRSYYKKKFFFSIRERIILHLSEYQIYENELEAPDELTQFGIAEIVLAGRSTCSKLLQEMEDKGLLYGRRAHVPSGKIRRTVYFLTPRGQLQAEKVRQKVEATIVKVRTSAGEVKKLHVPDVAQEVPVHAPLVDVVCHISRGVLDVASFTERLQARRQRVAYLRTMPRLRHFFDRETERRGLRGWLQGKTSQVLVLHGLPGVGKTTLAGKLVEDVRKEWSVFWYRAHEWSTPRDVAREMGSFLARLNRKDLLTYVETHEVPDFNEVFPLLEGNLQDARALLIFDDYHKAADRLDSFFVRLKESLKRLEGPKVLVLSQAVPKFYDRRDVKVEPVVAEMPLEGLDREGALTLLGLKNIPDTEFEPIYRQTQGHPLFLELLQGPDVADARDVDRFLEEELTSRLLDVERRVLGLASVFRKPVHADALFLEDDVDFIVITALSDRALLRETTPKVYGVHDVLRRHFYEHLTPPKRRRYHGWAAKYYAGQGDPGDQVEAQYHLLKAERPQAAARSAVAHGRSILEAGFQEEFAWILEHLRQEDLKPEMRRELLFLDGLRQSQLGEWDQAEKILLTVAEEAKQVGDGRVEAQARASLGEVHLNRGEYDIAEAELQRSLALAMEWNDLDAQAEAYYFLGFLRNMQSEFMEAYRHFRQGMHAALKTGNQAVTAKLLYAFGVNYGQRGNYKKSVSYKLRSKAILEELHDIRGLAKAHIGLGTSNQELENNEEALASYRRAMEYARLTGDQRILGYALQNAAGIYLSEDEVEKAAELVEEASAIFHRLGERRKIAWSLMFQGDVAYNRGNREEALRTWDEGVRRLRDLNDTRGVALFALTLARIQVDAGELEAGGKWLDVAEEGAKAMENEAVLQRVANERAVLQEQIQEDAARQAAEEAPAG